MAFDPIAYINEPRWQQSRLGLERIRELLTRLGRPQDRLKFVHVAGTNGKGSTCAYAASILQAAGYKTGLFTSPYIINFEERIRVNGRMISMDALTEVTLRVKEHAEAMAAETGDHPTEFELMTAVALEYFARQTCDIVVMEVGLGGRLDSTNAIDAPEVSVIARIGLDHTNLLGNTLAAIAQEKAGIIKTGASVVSWQQEPDAMAVIERIAAECGETVRTPDFSHLSIGSVEKVPFVPLQDASNVSRETPATTSVASAFTQAQPASQTQATAITQAQPASQTQATAMPHTTTQPATHAQPAVPQNVSRETFVRAFSYRDVEYETQLLGKYQPANAALALEVCAVLREGGWNIPSAAEREGIAQTQWQGRFEIVDAGPDRPSIVVDGGHNSQGAQALVESLDDVFPGKKPVFVIGVLEDKDYPVMLETVLPLGSGFVVTTPDNPRALPAAKLARAIRWTGQDLLGCSACVNPYVARNMTDALCRARELAGADGLICVFGSLYSIADVKRVLSSEACEHTN